MIWAVTTVFNPGRYESFVRNYKTFAARLQRQNVNLLTLEVAFGDDPFVLDGERIRAKDVLWLKERLINHARETLPESCRYVAWLDADVLLPDGWADQVVNKLQKVDVVQPFARVYHLSEGHTYGGNVYLSCEGIVSQRANSRRWLTRREDKDLPFAAPGFAWAARRNVDVYDRDIVGSGDCIFADSLLNSWSLHGFEKKFNEIQKAHIRMWAEGKKTLSVDYLPLGLFHLWHGSLRDRGYMSRHAATRDYDPETDVREAGPVLEWATGKKEMHRAVRDYFFARRDDGSPLLPL